MSVSSFLILLPSILLGVIAFFLAQFYFETKGLARDFHQAMQVQSAHSEAIKNLKKLVDHILKTEEDGD